MRDVPPIVVGETTCDVSIVIPVRNEILHIDRCLDSVLGQRVDGLSLEFLLVDGGSIDGTRQAILDRASVDPRVRLLDNPDGMVSPALNIGLRAARGRVVVRMDAHSIYEPDYVRQCVTVLEETGAAAVGGVQVPEPGADTRVARAIAAAQATALGTGGGHHRRAGYEGPAETLWLGAFRKEILARVGGFDEALYRSEDNDFYQRVGAIGGRLWVSARIRARYLCRGTLGAYARQCYVTGREIPRTLVRNPKAMALRHLVPGLAVAAAALLLALTAFAPESVRTYSTWVLAAVAATYVVLVVGASAVTASNAGRSLFLPLLAVLPTAHLSYGVGTIVGLTRAFRAEP